MGLRYGNHNIRFYLTGIMDVNDDLGFQKKSNFDMENRCSKFFWSM